MTFRFELLQKDLGSRARRGRLTLPHGTVETPVFMPVGTAATVKAIAPDDLERIGAQIVLGNTYHLFLRPGHERIRALGGLHRFMAWERPILTDSGGFQVYSLASARKIDEDGVTFRSHIDGSLRRLTPEISIEVQQALGSDIIMAFDECPPAQSSRAYHEESLERTTRWALRSKEAWNSEGGSYLFGIVQGGLFADLRRRHAEELAALDLPGYALGGYSVGEPIPAMYESISISAPLLPEEKPRYLMGVGTPEDLVTCVGLGIDMFDCVLPTRTARNARLYTSEGVLNIRNARFADDPNPVDPNCRCYTCRTFSRAYLRHLFQAQEILAARLATLHNLTFYCDLMAEVRRQIEAGNYAGWSAKWLEDRRLRLRESRAATRAD
ncbi:MAG: tRNA guanosine(34) transglycosylase Tgt [Pseudomonadota bacterium]|nr:MAG: tRNA guanosine(34) transglycosylase Tgt [Pseudomonadota bacterium]